mmetsp:Transcript_4630/g.9136  ORF Transcript_4630/g.9136 Transcript_4630/m.9136 type:complete len:425 (+) Transcript_4630:129-1403(+)|eukprot:CAMPEP_0173408448 /NCGR_PEP_ID=MMETSP1356-20130122/69762_1 /TAXON_ID=77927 ORGANISM="Hemiselmis virescens, Strain PCC157" /NCGR_SAMPLE_ID=MMETSP1356 /ASSEMBLY_ACC=CAM_ASM_000847 /LENGTH=424 /DNA_ID=CAMNT_0014369765 /DNA_START=72 /DNA_END=1346 /DNA_ORIENTATION=-
MKPQMMIGAPARKRGCCGVDDGAAWQAFKVGLCVFYYYSSSMGLILYNKWLFKRFNGGFGYPLTVTAFHFSLCFLFVAVWVRLREGSFCSVGSSRAVRRTVIVGLLTGIDVSLSNLSYLRVSIPFMEMVKSSSPIFVLLLSFAAGIEKPTIPLVAAMVLMSGGLAMSVEGELAFDAVGFSMCLGAGFTAASRLVVSHVVLHGEGDDRLDPVSLLYIVAPTSAAFIVPIALPMEAGAMSQSKFATDPALMRETIAVVIAGGVLAINLNFSEFLLLGKTSALTLNVAGIIKVIVVSTLSVLLFHSKVSPMNAIGYSVCVVGVIIYNRLKMFRREQKHQVAVVDGEALVFLTTAEDNEDEHDGGGGSEQKEATVKGKDRGQMPKSTSTKEAAMLSPLQPKKLVWQTTNAKEIDLAMESEKSSLLSAS